MFKKTISLLGSGSSSVSKQWISDIQQVRSYAFQRKSYGNTKGKTLQVPKRNTPNSFNNKPKSSSFNKSTSPVDSKSPKSTSKRKNSTPTSTNPDNLAPYKFGSYSGLKQPDEEKRKGIDKLISKVTDFNELRILPEVRDVMINELKKATVLRTQNYINSTKKRKTEDEINGLILRPTPIQTAAIKLINSTRKASEFLKVFTLAAETGSGKTWAYLAPMFHKLIENNIAKEKLDDELYGGSTGKSKAGIKNIILLPTHELVDQVHTTVSNISEKLNLKIVKWDTDSNFKSFIEDYRKGIDVLVTTPGKLMSLTKYDSISDPRALLSSVQFCVVDEADTLMDQSWLPETYGVIKYMTGLHDLVFVSATIPSDFNKTITKLFPMAIPITTPSLHKLPKSIEFRVINASVAPYKGSKMKAMAQALYAIHCDGTEYGYEKRVIVFVNGKDDCMKVAEKLEKTYNHNVKYISSDDDIEVRKEKVKEFIEPPKELEPGAKQVLKVLVCTDLVSRGINFTGIRNVILLDVPKTSVDLVHRAGRTGRMNQSGRVFMIMTDQDRSHVKGLPKVIRNNRRLA
ncbi:hypothetical protein CANARDRAFT_27762 [[Candida] arabinofermentans NRRL YB-2248]|uniref:RNA helicase n=1 Tax=[Candida] arabinofermentans NRRL YB-2248 TaxID=983967 RepID=A0A1E4T1T6_9ASCO|nr:hypothetical protein CANARDRAFT_27762 [[Candida] arabinofermentans NRRL YB-2248]